MLRRFASFSQSPSSSALWCAVAHTTKFVYVANRKRVELSRALKYVLPTRLAAAAPEIAAEWDFDRNSTFDYPQVVAIGSLKPYWWKCSKCTASFQASPERRIVRGFGCPHCTASALSEEIRSPKKKKGPGKKPLDLLPGERNARLRPKHVAVHKSLIR
jgi:hypothetical protein